jgi:hypothetical protein
VTSGGAQWNELNDFDGEDRLDLVRIGLERQISRRISAQISAQYNNRDTDDSDRDYTERAAGVLVTASF